MPIKKGFWRSVESSTEASSSRIEGFPSIWGSLSLLSQRFAPATHGLERLFAHIQWLRRYVLV